MQNHILYVLWIEKSIKLKYILTKSNCREIRDTPVENVLETAFLILTKAFPQFLNTLDFLAGTEYPQCLLLDCLGIRAGTRLVNTFLNFSNNEGLAVWVKWTAFGRPIRFWRFKISNLNTIMLNVPQKCTIFIA